MVLTVDRLGELSERIVTAPLAAAGLIVGFGVTLATGSRPLGGVVLAVCGASCVAVWLRRDGPRTAIKLTAAGLFGFALSHLLGLVIGAWPAVLAVSAATAGLCWWVSDSRRRPRTAGERVGPGSAAGPPTGSLRTAGAD